MVHTFSDDYVHVKTCQFESGEYYMENAQLKTGEIKYDFDKCKICDGPIKTLKKRSFDGLVLAKCKNCGLTFVKLIPVSRGLFEDSPERTAECYSHLYSQTPEKFSYGLNKILSYLKPIGKEDDIANLSLLDVGCGNGDFILLCKDKGFNVSGVEDSEGAARLCKKRGLDNIYITDLADIESSFDVITLFDVAEHVEDLKSFFKAICDKLNSKGIVYIETPRKSVIDIYLGILELFTPIKSNRITRAHVQLFSDKSLRVLLEKYGFDVISLKRRQSLSFADKKQYIYWLGVKSKVIVAILEKIANIALALRVFGRNKAVVMARKN